MKLNGIEVVDDPDGVLVENWPEIDLGVIVSQEKEIKQDNDRFKKIRIPNQSRKVKSKFKRLQKKFEGKDGTASKYKDPEEVDGYSVFDVVVPPYDQDALAQLYDENAVHRACVDARVMNTVGLGNRWDPTLKSRRKTEKLTGDKEKMDRWRGKLQREAENLDQLFDEFNEEETFQETLIKVWTDVLSIGNGYMEVGRDMEGKIGYMGHIPAPLVRVRRKRDGYVQYAHHKAVFFRNFQDQVTSDPINSDSQPNEILHFKVYSPTDNYYGVPPAVSAISAIMGDKFAKEHNIDYFENKAIPRYAIIIKGVKLSEKSKQQMINYFRNEVKGKSHGTLVIPLPAAIGSGKDVDIKFEKLETEIQDASFDKYRKSNRDEIVTAYRIPPTKVSIFDNANLAVSRDADKTFKVQVIGPDQVNIEKRINRIIAEFSDILLWRFRQLDLIDDDLRSRIHDRYLRTRVLSPNEVREDLEKPVTEDGEKMLIYPPEGRLLEKGINYLDPPDEIVRRMEEKDEEESDNNPFGNSNAAGNRAPQDTEGKESTPKDDTGENSERGEQQDRGNTRERS